MRPHWHAELIKALYPRYRRASRRDKGRILDQFCVATGYHRKYAIRLLRRPPRPRPGKPRGRPAVYASALDRILAVAWMAMGQPGSTRLSAELPRCMPWLRRRFELTPRQERMLLSMSRRTVDRRLRPFRDRLRRWEEDPRVRRSTEGGRRRSPPDRTRSDLRRSPPVTGRAAPTPKLWPNSDSAKVEAEVPGLEITERSSSRTPGFPKAGQPRHRRRRRAMEIRTRKQQGVTIISVEGAMVLTNESFPVMKQVMQHLKAGERQFVIDLGKVDKMDSAGVGELVAANVSVKEKGGKLHLANFHENVGKILQMALIHKLMPTFDTQKEAIAAFGKEGGGD